MTDIAKITVWVPDQDALRKILAAAHVSVNCGAPKGEPDGLFIVTLYATNAEAQKVAALGYKYEIDEHYGAVLEQRRQEVSKTDRFQGGTIKPRGLGDKR